MVLPAAAITLSGEVNDSDEAHIADVVVTAIPTTGQPLPSISSKSITVTLDQHGREFIPHVLVIPKGTSVIFPNSDKIQHHVYSFSSAKSFEIKLYKGTPEPIVFNQAGVVALGCNIHDWMLGYVFVTEAPHFTKTDASGRWSLELGTGEYKLTFWHPDASVLDALPNKTVYIPISKPIQYNINLNSYRRNGKPPSSDQIQGYSDGF
jgi:plastocyanin